MGNRGLVLTLDSIIAMAIVLTLLAAANYYTLLAERPTSSTRQILLLGYDILAILDYRGTLAELNLEHIKGNISLLSPPNYALRCQMKTYRYLEERFSLEQKLTFGPEIPEDVEDVVHVQRTFIVPSEDTVSAYGIIECWLWSM